MHASNKNRTESNWCVVTETVVHHDVAVNVKCFVILKCENVSKLKDVIRFDLTSFPGEMQRFLANVVILSKKMFVVVVITGEGDGCLCEQLLCYGTDNHVICDF